MTTDAAGEQPGIAARRSGAHQFAVFHERTGLLTIWLCLGVFVVVQGLLTIVYFKFYADEIETGLRWVMFGLAISLVCFGLYFLTYAASRLRDQQAPIVIGPSGLHDRHVSDRPIAWSDVVDVRLFSGGRGGPYVVFEVKPGSEDRAGIWPVRRMIASLVRLFGYPGYRVYHMGTDATPDSLVSAIGRYSKVGK